MSPLNVDEDELLACRNNIFFASRGDMDANNSMDVPLPFALKSRATSRARISFLLVFRAFVAMNKFRVNGRFTCQSPTLSLPTPCFSMTSNSSQPSPILSRLHQFSIQHGTCLVVEVIHSVGPVLLEFLIHLELVDKHFPLGLVNFAVILVLSFRTRSHLPSQSSPQRLIFLLFIFANAFPVGVGFFKASLQTRSGTA